MNIEELKLKDVLTLAAALRGSEPTRTAFWEIGKKYFIRTVTHHHTGELVAVTEQEIVLKNAAWIADDGRLTDSLRTGQFNEVEMFPTGNVLVGRGSIIDAVEITTIPTSQK
jgi:hypothetical protein